MNMLPIYSHENEMGREGEGENSPNLYQEVEEGERKKMECLVSWDAFNQHLQEEK